MTKNTKKMRGNRTAIVALAAIVCVGVIAGTFAYFTREVQFANVFGTKGYSSSAFEIFESPDDWEPGAVTEKEVFVENTGSGDIITRVSISEESWISGNEGELPLVTADGVTAAIKNFVNTDLWLDGGDGYWYYQGVLSQGDSTEAFLGSVEFNGQIKPDVQGVDANGNFFGDVDATGYNADAWTEDGEYLGWTEVVEGKTIVRKDFKSTGNGYDDATYTLTIQVDMLQASRDAMITEWSYDADATEGAAFSLYTLLTK